MHGIARSLAAFGVLAGVTAVPAMAAECSLKRYTTIDTVATRNGSMLVPVNIGDAPRFLLFDTGGLISGLSRPAAEELGLNTLESNVALVGIGGAVSNRYTVLPSLSIGTLELKSMKFMILPGDAPMAPDGRLAGTLAPNPNTDFELDFAGRKLSLFSTDHCDGQVVYWPAAAVAVVPMRTAGLGHIVVPVKLDGKEMDALIDTGASDTFLNLTVAAQRFDVRPDSPDVEPGGPFGQNPSMTIYRRRFAALSFEGVTVTNPMVVLIPDRVTQRLVNGPRTGSLIRERNRGLPDLIVGMSVLSKTHMYISYKEKKIYITAAEAPAAPP